MTNDENEPQGRRAELAPYGQLLNNNPPCDLQSLPRCQATAKSTGKRCGNPAMRGKKVCYIHGGKSRGPRTKEGKLRSKYANLRHGNYTAEAIARRKEVNQLFRECRKFMKDMGV